jgi:hypothetical protein
VKVWSLAWELLWHSLRWRGGGDRVPVSLRLDRLPAGPVSSGDLERRDWQISAVDWLGPNEGICLLEAEPGPLVGASDARAHNEEIRT